MSLAISNIEFDNLTADPSPLANGMKWFRSDLNEYREYKNGRISITSRNDFEKVKSGDQLNEFFPNVAGVITLTKNIEIEGYIITPYQVDLNGFYYVGRNAFSDRHIYTGNADAFIGANGGTIKLITLVAADLSSKLFNLIDTVGDKFFVLRDSIIANCNDVGLIRGFNTVAVDILNCVNNTNGVIYRNIQHCFVQNVAWNVTNSGTFESYVGVFELIQRQGGEFHVDTGNTGINVDEIVSVNSGELLSTPFVGGGTYTVGTFTNEWLVDCQGIDLEGDKFSAAFLTYENGTTNTALTQNVWEYFDMTGATIDTDTNHRFSQLGGFPDTLVYDGIHNMTRRVVATFGLQRIGTGTNKYQMRIVVNGVQVGGAEQFEISGVDSNPTLTANVYLQTGDQIWAEIRNITDDDDVRLLSANITVK